MPIAKSQSDGESPRRSRLSLHARPHCIPSDDRWRIAPQVLIQPRHKMQMRRNAIHAHVIHARAKHATRSPITPHECKPGPT